MKKVCHDENCLNGTSICDKHKAELISEWERVIPPRYKNANLSDFSENVTNGTKEYTKSGNPQGLYIFGDIGCGKTHLKWAIVKHMINTLPIKSQEQPIPFDEYDCKKLNYTFHWYYTGRGDSSVVSFINSFIRYETVLMLDDFGHGETTKDTFAVNMWNILLDEIYNANKRVILVSNYTLDKLSERVGLYATDRINQICKGSFIELTGKSKR
jgi:DNA replication protein DnaC